MSSDSTQPTGAGIPAPAFELKTMGDVLVLLHASGHRLDKIMGEADFIKIQRGLINHGLLDEHGEPTPLGYRTGDAFLKKRDEAQRLVRQAQVQKQPGIVEGLAVQPL